MKLTRQGPRNPAEILEEGNRHAENLRRIASYLGYKYCEPVPTSGTAAKKIRELISQGCGDEELALYLDFYFGFRGKRRGRSPGTGRADGVALRALELQSSDPDYWTWSRIADELREVLGCKVHVPGHRSDDECCRSLSKSAERLRSFLQELQSEFPLDL